MVGQDRRRDLQGRIARRVAEPVVDRLEPVEIEEDQAAGRLVALAEGDHPRQLAGEGPPVEHGGQGIAVGQELDLVEAPLQPRQLGAQGVGLGARRRQRRPHRRRQFVVHDGSGFGGFHATHGGAGPNASRLEPPLKLRPFGGSSAAVAGAGGGPILSRLSKGPVRAEGTGFLANQALVAIIMGSRSDWPTMKHAADALDALGVAYEAKVVSAHRTPDRLYAFAKGARGAGFKVIVAGAGGAAHLPGMAASMTELPVLGVPVRSEALSGLDSLLSIVQMPGGVPVATLAVGPAGAKNAGLLAAQILALSDEGLAARLAAFRRAQTEAVGEGVAD